MHSHTSSKALRAIAFSLVALSACTATMAGESIAAPLVLAKADTTMPFVHSMAPAAATNESAAAYPSLAEAELIGMGYSTFDAVLAEALGTATAAGYGPAPSRGAVEAVVARLMGGLMP